MASGRIDESQNSSDEEQEVFAGFTIEEIGDIYGGPWVSRHKQISHGTTKNSHGTTKNSHGTTRYLTTQPNISRHNQIFHGTTK